MYKTRRVGSALLRARSRCRRGRPIDDRNPDIGRAAVSASFGSQSGSGSRASRQDSGSRRGRYRRHSRSRRSHRSCRGRRARRPLSRRFPETIAAVPPPPRAQREPCRPQTPRYRFRAAAPLLCSRYPGADPQPPLHRRRHSLAGSVRPLRPETSVDRAAGRLGEAMRSPRLPRPRPRRRPLPDGCESLWLSARLTERPL